MAKSRKVTIRQVSGELNAADLPRAIENIRNQYGPSAEQNSPVINPEDTYKNISTNKPSNAGNISPMSAEPNLDDIVENLKKAGIAASIKRQEELQEKITEENLVPMRITSPLPITDKGMFRRIALPTNGTFYDINNVGIKEFDVPAIIRLYECLASKDETMLLDILDAHLSVDIRDLADEDSKYILYWQRIHSFPRSPYTLYYTSMYGNRNEITLNMSTLEVKTLDNLAKKYDEYQELGFAIPTVRDNEEFNSKKHLLSDAELKFVWPKARFMQGNSLEEKLARVQLIDPDTFFKGVNEFKNLFTDYGVTEKVMVKDPKFKAPKAVEYLRKEFETLTTDFNYITNDAEREVVQDKLNNIEKEISRIETSISNTGEAEPMLETIRFGIQLADFFPEV